MEAEIVRGLRLAHRAHRGVGHAVPTLRQRAGWRVCHRLGAARRQTVLVTAGLRIQPVQQLGVFARQSSCGAALESPAPAPVHHAAPEHTTVSASAPASGSPPPPWRVREAPVLGRGAGGLGVSRGVAGVLHGLSAPVQNGVGKGRAWHRAEPVGAA